MASTSQYDQSQQRNGQPSDHHHGSPHGANRSRSVSISSGHDNDVSPLGEIDEPVAASGSHAPSISQGHTALPVHSGQAPSISRQPLERPNGHTRQQPSANIPLSPMQPQSSGLGGRGVPLDPGDPVLYPFSKHRQRLRLFSHALIRVLFTLALIAAFVALLLTYEKQFVFLSGSRNWFSAVTTGLSIALGLHLFSSLSWLAECVRWFILANRAYPYNEANLILQCDSQTNVVKLFVKTAILRFPKGLFANKIPLLSLLWVLINLGFQIAIASLGLTYDITDSPHLFLTQGPVGVPNLGAFEWRNNTEVNQNQQLYAAHSLGLIGSSMYFGSDQDDNYLGAVQDLTTSAARTIFQDPDGWTYRFVDSSPDGKITFATQRTISSKFNCSFYDVQHGGDGENVFNTISADGFNRALYIGDVQPGASTYLTRGDYTCGDNRCTRVLAFQARDLDNNITAAGFYDCNITISTVSGAYHPAHELADSQAQIAAGAISFGGPKNTSSGFDNTSFVIDGTAYQLYPNNAYGANSTLGNATAMGAFLSSFAIQSIASIAAFIPRETITTGQTDSPTTGFSLDVDWTVAGPIFGILGLGHVLLSLLMIVPASRVLVIREEGMGVVAGSRGKKGDMVRYGCAEKGGKGEEWWHVAVSREMVGGSGGGKRSGVGKWPDGMYDAR